ncbi:DUF4202 domain-containing protein [Kushneria marisflavi]|uniref:Uncharacterized protein n=1 Tax=Kushneria marisflavi TaxID=157779 RepID=A0A240ULY5_9GAMM|nr:DUF4202 domain-containing protein [Kushneria marisflavi]ART62052.1 hypothetical protein B9H00_02335 [Kushneria marisflavi]RKD87118.1 uncharacterized protein DUF4202 [Kushneria marisflavi]
MADNHRFDAAMAQLDALHAEDPRMETVDGEQVPYELLYAQRMSEWLERLRGDASETLQLAVRAQHLKRWEVPRDSYPMDRPGYHAWRTGLKTRQADMAAEVLRQAGYDEADCARVAALIRKEDLKNDEETCALEDAACLVFLQDYYAPFAAEHDDDKVLGILRKTLRKMSAEGHRLAGEIVLEGRARALVEKAVAMEMR